VSRCDGSEITDLRAVKESIYSKINGVFDLYSLWTSAFLHRTYIPPYCTNGKETLLNLKEIGDVFDIHAGVNSVALLSQLIIYLNHLTWY
jgi:hypothetical protein